jgi:hypothetical protein
VLSGRFAMLIAILFAAMCATSAQSIPSDRTNLSGQSVRSDHPDESNDLDSSLLTPLKPQGLDAPYHPIEPRQTLRWFITSSIGPPHLAGVIFVSASGTAVDRPKEYGPHWGGFAARFGSGMAGSVTGNAIEASAGLMLREDPRYFRVPGQAYKARVGNVVRLTFVARGNDGRLGPRTLATWRLSAVISSQTHGAFTAKRIRNLHCCARRKVLPDVWLPMRSRSFGPTSRGISFTSGIDIGLFSEFREFTRESRLHGSGGDAFSRVWNWPLYCLTVERGRRGKSQA